MADTPNACVNYSAQYIAQAVRLQTRLAAAEHEKLKEETAKADDAKTRYETAKEDYKIAKAAAHKRKAAYARKFEGITKLRNMAESFASMLEAFKAADREEVHDPPPAAKKARTVTPPPETAAVEARAPSSPAPEAAAAAVARSPVSIHARDDPDYIPGVSAE